MTTTAGRGGMPSSKSGQRVEGSSKVEPSPGCWTATKSVSVVVDEPRAAELGSDRNPVEVPGRAAQVAVGLHRPETVGPARRLGAVAVGRDPEPAGGVDGAVVGHPEPAVLRRLGREGGADLGHGGIAALDQDLPVHRVGGEVAVRRLDLDDVAERVLGPRVRRVLVARLAAGVVGQHHVDAAVPLVRLDVLGPVHRRRLEEVGGAAGLDQHVALVGEAVLLGERPLAVNERQPVHRAVVVEPRDRRACRGRAGPGRGSPGRRRRRSGSGRRIRTARRRP